MSKRFQLSVIAVLSFIVVGAPSIKAQQTSKTKEGAVSGNQARIARGKYIVEAVAMCERCHTPRDEHGVADRARWLKGGPTQTQPTYPSRNWAVSEPRLAGGPPGTDAEFITLLTTGISRTGQPPNLPMPPFRMTREDAEAVLAYLKSL